MLNLLFFSVTLAFDIYVENNNNSTLVTLDEEDRYVVVHFIMR